MVKSFLMASSSGVPKAMCGRSGVSQNQKFKKIREKRGTKNYESTKIQCQVSYTTEAP